MRVTGKIMALCAFMLLGVLTPAQACDEFKNLSLEETKELRDKLVEEGADSLDRLFAFQELACSNEPTVRAYAIQAGLSSASDPLVRNKIMFEALMQKTRIDVEMFPNGDSTERDKKFVANYQGVLTREVEFRDRKLGCIGINRRNCDPRISLYIKGDTVEYSLNSTKGLFKLSPQNELVGYIIADQSSYYKKIPAIIKLF